MACCILTAYCMSQLLRACEYLDVSIVKPKYNAFHDGPDDDLATSSSPNPLSTAKILLEGMTCAACVSAIEHAVNSLDGIQRIAVSLPLSRATVVYDSGIVSVDEIVGAVEGRGYGARAGERSARENLEFMQSKEEKEKLTAAFTHAAFVASALTALEWTLFFRLPIVLKGMVKLAVAGMALWIQGVDAWYIHHNAWKRGLTASLTMDSLVSLSLLLGVGLSIFNLLLFGLETARVYWSEISFLATVILGARLLDLMLRKQSAATFARLYELQDKAMNVRLIKSYANPYVENQVVDAATLVVNDQISIAPGAIIPCDCYVMDGETLVDQATMTGESLPVLKKAGDQLLAGTTNLSNEIHAIVSKPQEDSALETLISSISTATETSSSNKEVDVMISKFAAGVIFLTLVSFTKTLLANWKDRGISLAVNVACERAMAVLASACPCAIGLAKPTAVMAGLNAAQARGVIVKGGIESFRALAALTHVVLDKTGTLTTGQLSVSDTNLEFDDVHRMLLCVAERDAHGHPIGRAVFQWCYSSLSLEQRRVVNDAIVRKVENKTGDGVACEVNLGSKNEWYTVHVGNKDFLARNHITLRIDEKMDTSTSSQTKVHLAINNTHNGTLHLQDTIRPSAPSVITHLKSVLNLHISMLTGDTQEEATRVSDHLSIPVTSSHATPLAKQSYIQNLRESSSHTRVAMLGDGLNDAPALAAADVGIALTIRSQSRAASIAQATNAEVGDVVFTSPHLTRLPELIEIARKTTRQAGRNLWWAVGYNVVAVSLAMGVMESFGLRVDAARAGTMMAFSSLTVMGLGVWLQWELGRVGFEGMVERGKLRRERR